MKTFVRTYDAPNENLVSEVLISFEALELQQQLEALTSAIFGLLEWVPKTLGKGNPHQEEQARRDLNKIISLAGLLEEVVSVYLTHACFMGQEDLNLALTNASSALISLQEAKDTRIAQIHAESGENFGSRTGFQTHDYRNIANKITEYLNKPKGKIAY